MGRPSATATLHRLQRRFSIALSAALCLWMLALATHFHSSDFDTDSHQATHELCAFCVSVPGTGAAPSVAAYLVTPQPQSFTAPVDIAPTTAAPAPGAYYSRGPPLI
ncbi:hypothetical protein JM946_10870 [Steroidobacter sp. S1-65]|uniref:DUF2946 domain-containing protein n=1 Tax=Steroidobacter gossypii TaxID=2805490 RepID=A0ABS1WWA7_9GAMM|nr:hypothetical protein [Steroidobacter gossypii]MBM0105255.1 hypothetical protein [Steroidobacter gossypii]